NWLRVSIGIRVALLKENAGLREWSAAMRAMRCLVPSRAGFRHATDEQNHGAVHRKGNAGIACEISPGSSASD
ncbi:hypothetical protein, partial [Paraburkholderia aspalathi]|uniref:hypothetical protein n=1 Tax=Paraburkholderia aspalathi TaxID=1324617 RepID=UPI001BAA157B